MRYHKMLFGTYCLLLALSISVTKSTAHEWMAPADAADVKNPIVMNEASVEKGRTVYVENCAACHGKNLEGLAAEEIGLETSSPNLKERIRNHRDGDFFWKIQQGRGYMPSFAKTLSDEEIWEVINYIRDEAE